jgi:lipopolysaccharide export system permease protein
MAQPPTLRPSKPRVPASPASGPGPGRRGRLPRYDAYVLRQLAVGLVAATLGLAVLVWLTQSLRFLELVLNRGLAFGVFLELTLLLMPNLVAVILPVTLFGVVLFTYHRLTADRELVVMRGAGLSPLALARPALVMAFATMALGWFLNLYLVPESHRGFREFQFEIRNRIGAVLIEDGVFNQVGDGLTVYVRARGRDGTLRGILVHDARDRANPATILAEEGRLAMTASGPRVTLLTGSRQEVDRETGRLRVLWFAENTIDLARASSPEEVRYRDARERGLGELLDPPDRASVNPRDLVRFWAEAHGRFAQPVFGFSLALVALAGVLAGGFSRHGGGLRVLATVGMGAALVALGLAITNLAGRQPALIPLVWAHAVLPGLLAGLAVAAPHRLPRMLRA